MKQGIKPTRDQKILLKEKGLNHGNWLVTKNLPEELHIVHRHTSTTRIMPKRKGVKQ